MLCFSQHHLLQPHHSILQGLLQLFSAAFGFCYSEWSTENFIGHLFPFFINRHIQQFLLSQALIALTDDNPLLGKLPTHLSAFISHLLAYYLLSRDSLMRCPQTLRAQQDLWPWSSHPWSILKKKPYFPIWSLSPTPHFSGFNNVLH